MGSLHLQCRPIGERNIPIYISSLIILVYHKSAISSKNRWQPFKKKKKNSRLLCPNTRSLGHKVSQIPTKSTNPKNLYPLPVDLGKAPIVQLHLSIDINYRHTIHHFSEDHLRPLNPSSEAKRSNISDLPENPSAIDFERFLEFSSIFKTFGVMNGT